LKITLRTKILVAKLPYVAATLSIIRKIIREMIASKCQILERLLILSIYTSSILELSTAYSFAATQHGFATSAADVSEKNLHSTHGLKAENKEGLTLLINTIT
jgi:hypothetical protein